MNSESLRLIAVTSELSADPTSLTAISAAAVRGGATMVQLRLKHADARTLIELARALVRAVPAPIIINDRADIAIAAGAAGVHLGSNDVPVAAIRSIAPPGFIIGASVGGESEVSNAALADYVGIGPAFATQTKPDAGDAIGAEGIRKLAALCAKPAVAIGGIDPGNVGLLRTSGVYGVAVVGAIYLAPDAEKAAQELRAAVDSWKVNRKAQ